MSFAMPGKIIEEYTVRRNRLGLVQFGDTNRPIFLDLVPDAHVGDYVRVHVGFATELVSAEDAAIAYASLAKCGQLASTEFGLQSAEATPEAARRVKPR
jgi:hydrogenase expression/formation protein HypC